MIRSRPTAVWSCGRTPTWPTLVSPGGNGPQSSRRSPGPRFKIGSGPDPGRLGYLIDGQLFTKEIARGRSRHVPRPGRGRSGVCRRLLLRTREPRAGRLARTGVIGFTPRGLGSHRVPRPRDRLRPRDLTRPAGELRPRDRHFDHGHQGDPGRSRGGVAGVASSSYGYETPRPLWTEQHPGLWWDATIAAVRQVMADLGISGSDVEAIGLTGQMHGSVLLDSQGEVVRPAILWNDQRTEAECDEIRRRVGADRLIEVTGNDALTGFTAPKLLWVQLTRARELGQGQPRPPAQGLRPLPAHR